MHFRTGSSYIVVNSPLRRPEGPFGYLPIFWYLSTNQAEAGATHASRCGSEEPRGFRTPVGSCHLDRLKCCHTKTWRGAGKVHI